jgi:hypothetical protein
MNTQSKIVTGCQLPVTSAVSSPTGNRKLETICAVALIALSLSPQLSVAQMNFNHVTINLNNPQYQSLKLDGSYIYVNEAGMQGVILYRVDQTTYIAYERKCSVGDEAPVSVDGSTLFMKGCGGTYNFSDGYPSSGPSNQPLLKYRINLTGQILVITDEAIF